MDISSYNCGGHDGGEAKLDEHDTFTIGQGTSGPELGDRLEYWTPRNLDGNKSLRLNLGKTIAYGDSTDPIMLSKDGGIGDDHIRNWRVLTGGNRITLGSEQVGACSTIENKGPLGGSVKDGRNSENLGEGVGEERWEAAAAPHAEGRAHAVHKLEEESGQVDWSIHNRSSQGPDVEANESWGPSVGGRRGQEDRWGASARKEGLSRGHVTYGECQKNQSADRGTTSFDGCGEFMPSGKEEKLALACAACGCHRNFHQRIVLGEDEDEDPREAPDLKRTREKGEVDSGAGSNVYLASICNIERVAHELMAAANRAIPLAQDSLGAYRKGRARDFALEERNIMAKISIENLDHIAKMMLSTVECLTLLQKPALSPRLQHAAAARGAGELGPSSSDVSPVSTVEKRGAIPLPTLSPPPPFVVSQGGPPLMHPPPVMTLSSAGTCGAHMCMGRKLAERGNHKSKRTRTRISLEQREKLNAFAEKAGWTIVGQRKETIEAACQDIGIEPKTLKYWIHNSKQKWKRHPGQGDESMSKQ